MARARKMTAEEERNHYKAALKYIANNACKYYSPSMASSWAWKALKMEPFEEDLEANAERQKALLKKIEKENKVTV